MTCVAQADTQVVTGSVRWTLVLLMLLSCKADEPSPGSGGGGLVGDAGPPPGAAPPTANVPDAKVPAANVPDARVPDANVTGTTMFVARFEGDAVVVTTPTRAPLYYAQCTAYYALEKRSGDAFIPLRDDRPNPPPTWGPHTGYYLDDEFVPPNYDEGCDVLDCATLRPEIHLGSVLEYVQTSTRPPLADPAYEGREVPATVPVIESRTVHGRIRARIGYSTDASCVDDDEALLELDLPEEGVCCPIGHEGCTSGGPGGGWAPTADACAKWDTDDDLLSTREDDAHGCPKLVSDYGCCGCEDGGI